MIRPKTLWYGVVLKFYDILSTWLGLAIIPRWLARESNFLFADQVNSEPLWLLLPFLFSLLLLAMLYGFQRIVLERARKHGYGGRAMKVLEKVWDLGFWFLGFMTVWAVFNNCLVIIRCLAILQRLGP